MTEPTELPNFDCTSENAARYIGFTDNYAVMLASRRGHTPISYRPSYYVIDQTAREFFEIVPAENHQTELVFELEYRVITPGCPPQGIVVAANFGLYYLTQHNIGDYDRRTWQK